MGVKELIAFKTPNARMWKQIFESKSIVKTAIYTQKLSWIVLLQEPINVLMVQGFEPMTILTQSLSGVNSALESVPAGCSDVQLA